MSNNNKNRDNHNQQIIPPLQNPQRPLSNSTSYGRIVYLHFACRAPLPIGSFLRVTSSQLWAPGTLHNDPTDAKNVSVEANQSALPNNTVDGLIDGFGESEGSYASSVEMVTSPGELQYYSTTQYNAVHSTHSTIF